MQKLLVVFNCSLSISCKARRIPRRPCPNDIPQNLCPSQGRSEESNPWPRLCCGAWSRSARPSSLRSCCGPRVDPRGLLMGGTPGLVKRCSLSVLGLSVCLGSGWAISPLSLKPIASCPASAGCVFPASLHVPLGPPCLLQGGLASPLP